MKIKYYKELRDIEDFYKRLLGASLQDMLSASWEEGQSNLSPYSPTTDASLFGKGIKNMFNGGTDEEYTY